MKEEGHVKPRIEIEWVKYGDLKPATYNPRRISEAMLMKLKKGIREFGIIDPLVINKDGTVIGGHQRLKAGLEEGYDEFPCVRLDLGKKQEKALNLALNKLSGEWDFELLSTLLSEFETDEEFDIELTGFDPIEALESIKLDPADFTIPSVGGPTGSMLDDGEGDDKTPGKGVIIQYSIIFDDEEQQAAWHEYIKALKAKYPEEETIAARLIKDIERSA